jgi:hypothetical protein
MVRIEGNRASSHSIQLNYPLSVDAFVAIMQAKQVTGGKLPPGENVSD